MTPRPAQQRVPTPSGGEQLEVFLLIATVFAMLAVALATNSVTLDPTPLGDALVECPEEVP